MSETRDPQTDFAAGIIPPIRATQPDDARDAIPLPGYRLAARFFDGASGIVDMSEMIASSAAGVFAALRDPRIFAAVRVELGAVTWPGDLDLAPDAMHDALATRGEWRST